METVALQPNPWMIIPFAVMLALIALAPLFFQRWWLRYYPVVAIVLGAITLTYYFTGFAGPERAAAQHRVWETAEEYIKFMALIGSLFVVSGGIHINIKGGATPLGNTVFLLVGALIANVLGTTGASMLLIRPWIRMNQHRITAHHIVFFIFIVSNVGGCLTPIGDPPLFLGFIRGIPFWWVAEHCLPMWAVGLGMLLAIFYVLDRMSFRRAPREVRPVESERGQWRFEGLGNLFYLGIILVVVFVHRPLFLRELVMIAAAAASWFTTKKQVHEANHFNFHPFQEVAILFIGIFATMIPALDWLANNARTFLGDHPSVGLFYWGSGSLSSLLDNAPTYLSFLSASFGAFIDPDIVAQVQVHIASGVVNFSDLPGSHALQIQQTLEALQKYHGADIAAHTVTPDEIKICFLLGNATFNRYLVALSVGAVFFGAFTYIGNGPNFMVKSIADHQKVAAPTFPAYVSKHALPFLLPVLLVVWWLFFRG